MKILRKFFTLIERSLAKSSCVAKRAVEYTCPIIFFNDLILNEITFTTSSGSTFLTKN